ncbi:NACHT, LRR and PYD domains-containing protein 3 [Labeo rohita]|uniref:NACHT, LRR and PYD domains-containing protein 3 n=1 Tax=Labeo rohita TaxID=84645 RepID=A0ABQ8LIK0_LABRO|nr:NACHT, LRR and PYD domains-containing protein 3 [Labeo rohita]
MDPEPEGFPRLRYCSIGEEGCAALISALRSNSSHQIELDLIGNEPGDSGMKLRSALLEDPHLFDSENPTSSKQVNQDCHLDKYRY